MRLAAIILACFFFLPLSGQRKWERLSRKFEKHYARPDFQAALDDAFRIQDYTRANYDSTDRRFALSSYYVSKAYEALGNAEQALPYIQDAYALLVPDLAYDENMIQVSLLYGKIQTGLGYHKSARVLISAAMEGSMELLGPESEAFLKALYALADLEMAMAHWEAFISLLTDALQIHERNFPLDHDYAIYANYMGLLFMNSELMQEAILYLNKSLSAYQPGVLKKDLTCANAHNNLGLIYYYQSKFEDAAGHFEAAASIYPGLTKDYSENYLMLLSNRASLYLSWEKPGETDASYAELETYLEKFSGNLDLPHIQGLENMANFYAERGSFDKAEAFYLRAIKARESMNPVDGVGLKRCINSLVLVCEEFNQTEKASYYLDMIQE